MDASTIAVGEYDEDQDEVFIGPGFLDGEEEEYYDEDEYDEEDYYEEQTGAPGDVAHSTTDDAPLDGGANHLGRGANPSTQPVQVSLHTQLGAAPGSAQTLPGCGNIEPNRPPQSSTLIKDKSMIEFASSGATTPLQPVQLESSSFNPDGTPLEDEERDLMNELQRVQREIAQKRAARKRHLEEQLESAKRQLSEEENAALLLSSPDQVEPENPLQSPSQPRQGGRRRLSPGHERPTPGQDRPSTGQERPAIDIYHNGYSTRPSPGRCVPGDRRSLDES